MPLTHREALQLGLLLLCVPLQYFLSVHLSTNETERSQLGNKLGIDIQHLKKYLHFDIPGAWRQLVGALATRYATFIKSRQAHMASMHDTADDPPESPAVEVHQYRQRDAGGQAVRAHRPPYLRYRVGQVVKHKSHGYRAVVVGWDLRARTGEATFPGVVFDSRLSQMLQTTPHYRLLIDQQDARSLSKSGSPNREAYVIQTSLELAKDTKIQHPELDNYFLYFDGGQYIPKDVLRKVYPKD